MTTVALTDIVFDAGTQVRASISEDVVSAYADLMDGGVQFPPVVLFHDGNRYYMADGFHRGLAAKRCGLTAIPADVHPGTTQDALWFALGANRKNGHRMTTADTRHAVELAVLAWPDKSPAQIAEQVGCTQQYAGRVRHEVQLTTSCKLPDRTIGKDGKSRSTTRVPRQTAPAPAEQEPMPSTASLSPLEVRRAMGVEGISNGVLRRLPKKSAAALFENALYAMQGIVTGLRDIDPAELITHPKADEWQHAIAEVVGVLRSLNRHLANRKDVA